MEPTTQNPPATPPDQAESRTKPLPATERDFRSRVSRTASPGFRIAIIIGVVILLVVGFFVYRYVTSYESTDDAEVDGHINSISARISGHVIKLNVQDNPYVRSGAGMRAARQQSEAAKAQLAQAVANDVKAQNDLGRYRQLVDKQEISQQQYDQAVAASRASAAAVDAARATDRAPGPPPRWRKRSLRKRSSIRRN